MTNEVQIFNGLKIKEENGQVLFDAETAAIGLGLTETKKGVLYVRWRTLKNYLSQEVAKGDFITEPQFYKLAIKANNETAEHFQDWVTTEVLPSIRKTGSYQSEPQFRLPANMAEMTQVVQAISGETNKRVDVIEDKVDNLIENQPINPTDYATIGSEVSRRAHAYGYMHKIPKEKHGELIHDLNSQILQVTGAKNRTRIKSNQFDMVMDLIARWEPTTAVLMKVQQTELEV